MAESVRMQQLKRLATAMPAANQKVATGLQEAQATQLQSAIAQASPAAGASTAQQVGAQQATALAAPQLQAQQANQQQVGQAASLAQNQAQTESAQRVGAKESGLNQTNINNNNRLATLDNDIKNQLLDQQLKFNKDERGRVLLNDRQLADAAILTAKNQEDLMNYKQSITQMNERKLQTMQTAYNQLAQAMRTGYDQDGQVLNYNTKVEIKNMMTDAQKAIQSEKNRQAANAAAWTAAGTIVGTVVGGVVGGPGGAKAGGEAGGAGGGYAASQE